MYYIKGHGWVRIHHSARKHGVVDEDICHAIGQAVVVMVMESDGTLSAIHAMPMPWKFERYLTQGDAT